MVDSRAVLEALFQAIEARNVGRVAELLADDVTAETEVISTPIRGKDQLVALLGAALDAFAEVEIEPKKVVVSGKDVAAFVDIHVSFRRDVQLLGETLSVAGKKVNVVGALFAEVNEAGQITHLMRVRDTLGIVRQLGIDPQKIDGLSRKFEERVEQQKARKRSAA